jgi:hypothetical protein
MFITIKTIIAALLLIAGISAAYAGGFMLLHVGDANGNGGVASTNFLLVDVGNPMLVNTGNQILVQ